MEFSAYPVHHLMAITTRPELVFVRGAGAWLFDQRGRRYLDFVQGWAVNSLGHAPELVARTLAAQAQLLVNTGPAFYNEPSIRLAQALTQNSCFQRVFFANSGAEANEGAIKLARKWGAKYKNGAAEIITFADGFHGRTLATMAASGKSGWDTLFAPAMPGFTKARFNDIDSVAERIGSATVAVMLEPVQGEAGVIPADPAFLQALRELTRRHGLLLIVDEVQTGMGRTGTLFAYQQAGIEPDIMTLGKGIGAGVPLAALLAREEVCCFEPGDQGGTYNGNPLMTAVGAAVLAAVAAPDFLAQVRARADYLSQRLQALSGRHGIVGERGVGLLRALVFEHEVTPHIVETARTLAPDGLLLNAPRPHLLRFMPALNVSEEEIDRMIALLEETLATLARG